MSFDAVAELCRELEVPYTRIHVPVYQIVFEERKEKNPCSLCAKLRRGSLNTALTERGIHKIALGHHYDDAIETLLMNLLFEGRIGCFQPVTYLDRTASPRSVLCCTAGRPTSAARWNGSACRWSTTPGPANGSIPSAGGEGSDPPAEGRSSRHQQELFGSLQRYPLYGWNLEQQER